jgi:hypothetical protein
MGLSDAAGVWIWYMVPERCTALEEVIDADLDTI